MKKTENEISSGRRDALKKIAVGSTAGFLGLFGSNLAAQTPSIPDYKKGMPVVKIKSVKAIATAPEGINLIVVKVETTEPGLYGLGCATFTQRAMAVVTAINSYLNDFWVYDPAANSWAEKRKINSVSEDTYDDN